MSTPFSQDAIDNDIRAIQTLLERRQSHFRFSPALEAAFRQHTQGRVLELLAQIGAAGYPAARIIGSVEAGPGRVVVS